MNSNTRMNPSITIINLDAKVFVWAFVIILLSALYGAARLAFGWGLDDTDKSKWERSGLEVLTDHGTGVQYVRNASGGMCVRVDPDGRPHMSDEIRRALEALQKKEEKP